jgi:hypothetical protein
MQQKQMHKMGYGKFAMMMLIGLIIMYLVMFLNITELNHYQTSATRIYMAILMVAPTFFPLISRINAEPHQRKSAQSAGDFFPEDLFFSR